jgi:hypothetical protein
MRTKIRTRASRQEKKTIRLDSTTGLEGNAGNKQKLKESSTWSKGMKTNDTERTGSLSPYLGKKAGGRTD